METPDTFIYMVAGYGILFGLLFLYVLSWWVRRRNLEKDLEVIATLQAGNPETERPADNQLPQLRPLP